MKLTDAQRRGLLAFNYRGGCAFVSNRTNRREHVVYWQTRNTLAAIGLVKRAEAWTPEYQLYELTDAGRAARTALAAEAAS